jgi:taurine dioxygenase
MSAQPSTSEVKIVDRGFAAEVEGIDLRQLDDAGFAKVRGAFQSHGLLFARNQQMSEDDHIAFAQRWGHININRFFAHVDGYPMIAKVAKEPEHRTNIGGGWHTDHSYDVEPALGSILYAREVPAQGGDTLFASMYLAYEALSDGLKDTLEGLSAVHSSRHVFGPQANRGGTGDARVGGAENATQDAVHPVVITHPESGRRALYVNPSFTLHFDGWSMEESRPLLNYLYQHAARPEFTLRWKWEPGTIGFWDNRATWHYAVNDYHGSRRLMHRITVEGCALKGA